MESSSIKENGKVNENKGSGESLYISCYEEWFDAIVQNNRKMAQDILDCASESERERLLNLPFSFDEGDSGNWTVFLPFHVAVCMFSKNIVKLFFKYNIDIFKIDNTGCNAMHACIIMSFNKPELEEKICDFVKWLDKELGHDSMTKLLCHENSDGFRPIEFASQQGCLLLMKTFLETSTYMTKVTTHGYNEKRYHDITEYETGSRQGKSPVNMLPFLDKDVLENPKKVEVILSPLILSWIDAKIKSNIIPVVIWAFLRLTFFLMYFLMDSDVRMLESWRGNESSIYICPELSYINVGSIGFKTVLLSYFIVYVIISLIIDIIDMVKLRTTKNYLKKYNINGKKDPVSNTNFYTNTNLFITVSILVICILQLMWMHGMFQTGMSFTINIARALIPLLMMWSVIYFLQLFPYIGPSMLSIQGMIIDMLRFCVLFFVVLLPFVHAFENFMHINSIDGCIPDFSSVLKTTYTLVLVMLNSYELNTLNVVDVEVLQMLHILYIFTVGILVLNFLIAVMSSKASQIAEKELIILKINQLAVTSSIENRLINYMKWLLRKLPKFGFVREDNNIFVVGYSCRIMPLFQGRVEDEDY